MIQRLFYQLQANYLPAGFDSRRWVKYLIAIGTLIASILVVRFSLERLVFLALVAVAGLAFALVIIRRPPLAILSLIFATLLVPTPLPEGSFGNINTPAIMAMLFLALWFFDMFVRKRRFQFAPSRTNLPLFLFLLIVCLSLINGQLQYYQFSRLAPITAQIGGFAIFILSAGTYLMTANFITERVWLQRLTWLFLFLSGIYVFSRITPLTDSYIRPLFQYGSDASLFWLWLTTLSVSQALFNTNLKKNWRILIFGIFLASVFVSLTQAYEWKSGWLPALIGLAVIIWIGIPKFRVPIIFLGAVIALGNFADVNQFLTGSEDYSILTRVEAWRIVLEIAKINPLIGLGPANYYWYAPLFPLLGYTSQFSSHNNYIDIIAQTGIIGLFLFLWFMWEVGYLAWKLYQKADDSFDRAFVVGIMGGVVGTLVAGMLGDWVIPFIYNVGLPGFRSSLFGWVFLGGLVVLEQIYRAKEL